MDLLDRLAFDVVHLPPLRIRPDDIPPLVNLFGRKIATELNATQFPGFTAEATETLEQHHWPGNVRELKNVVERSTVKSFLADESLSQPIAQIVLDPFQGPDWLQSVSAQSPRGNTTSRQSETSPETKEASENTDFQTRIMTFERRLIDEALNHHDHHQGKAADYLGLSYHQFRGLLRKHGLKK